jgi:hypothetical protein
MVVVRQGHHVPAQRRAPRAAAGRSNAAVVAACASAGETSSASASASRLT